MSLYPGGRRAARPRLFGTGESCTRVIPDNLSPPETRKSPAISRKPRLAGLSMGRFSILILLPGGPRILFRVKKIPVRACSRKPIVTIFFLLKREKKKD